MVENDRILYAVGGKGKVARGPVGRYSIAAECSGLKELAPVNGGEEKGLMILSGFAKRTAEVKSEVVVILIRPLEMRQVGEKGLGFERPITVEFKDFSVESLGAALDFQLNVGGRAKSQVLAGVAG